jgi:hypothetical protein
MWSNRQLELVKKAASLHLSILYVKNSVSGDEARDQELK